jgi:hypothetical protein
VGAPRARADEQCRGFGSDLGLTSGMVNGTVLTLAFSGDTDINLPPWLSDNDLQSRPYYLASTAIHSRTTGEPRFIHVLHFLLEDLDGSRRMGQALWRSPNRRMKSLRMWSEVVAKPLWPDASEVRC